MPYVYHLYFKPLDLHYYGVQYKKNCKPEDLWTKYFSSSKEVKRLIKIYGKDAFTATVRKVFKSKIEAIEWEHKFLLRINACRNPKWINKRAVKNDIMLNPDTVERVHSKLRSKDHYKRISKLAHESMKANNFDYGSLSRKTYLVTFSDGTDREVKDLKSFSEEIGCRYDTLRRAVSKNMPYKSFNILSVVLKDGFEPSPVDPQSTVTNH